MLYPRVGKSKELSLKKDEVFGFMFQFETKERSRARLVVIADDITGAFDTGVQFSKRGASVRVVIGSQLSEEHAITDVLVINAETRHLTADNAYRETYRIASIVNAWQIPYLYIKTDSGLRGNIGPAIKAVLDATHEEFAAFAPAYPDTNRITRDGCQWADGLLLQNSVYGIDLFEPVRTSRVSDLLTPYGLHVCECKAPCQFSAGTATVAVFDAECNEDFHCIAQLLKEEGRLRITAGCAAFAAALPSYLGLPDSLTDIPKVYPPLMIMCGSLNPVTRCQFEYGERRGYKRVILSRKQLLDENYLDSEACRIWLQSLAEVLFSHRTLMLDTGLDMPKDKPEDDLEETRVRISCRLGALLARLLSMREAKGYTPMIIGGDTLMGFLTQLENPSIKLEGEVSAGVVMFSIVFQGQPLQMLSKSGGFGSRTLLSDVLCEKVAER